MGDGLRHGLILPSSRLHARGNLIMAAMCEAAG